MTILLPTFLHFPLSPFLPLWGWQHWPTPSAGGLLCPKIPPPPPHPWLAIIPSSKHGTQLPGHSWGPKGPFFQEVTWASYTHEIKATPQLHNSNHFNVFTKSQGPHSHNMSGMGGVSYKMVAKRWCNGKYITTESIDWLITTNWLHDNDLNTRISTGQKRKLNIKPIKYTQLPGKPSLFCIKSMICNLLSYWRMQCHGLHPNCWQQPLCVCCAICFGPLVCGNHRPKKFRNPTLTVHSWAGGLRPRCWVCAYC